MKPTKKNHYLLRSLTNSLFAVNVQVNYGSKLLEIGYLFIDNLTEDKVLVDSETGYRYLVFIPEEMQNIKSSSQFNLTLTFEKEEIVEYA